MRMSMPWRCSSRKSSCASSTCKTQRALSCNFAASSAVAAHAGARTASHARSPAARGSSQKLPGCVRNISNSLARRLQMQNSVGGARACCGVLVALSDDACDAYVRVPAMWPMLFVVTSCRFWPGRYVTMMRSAGAFAGYAPATGVPPGAIDDPQLVPVSMNEGGMPGCCCCGPAGPP
jgi:hypothetical protein